MPQLSSQSRRPTCSAIKSSHQNHTRCTKRLSHRFQASRPQGLLFSHQVPWAHRIYPTDPHLLDILYFIFLFKAYVEKESYSNYFCKERRRLHTIQETELSLISCAYLICSHPVFKTVCTLIMRNIGNITLIFIIQIK